MLSVFLIISVTNKNWTLRWIGSKLFTEKESGTHKSSAKPMKGMILVNHNYFTQRDVERLEEQAVQIRQDIISMIHAAKAGHPGGSLSAVEMVTALYFHVMNIDPQNPRWEDRDRFILSKGHSCPVMYAALARRGYFDPALLNTLRQYHSILAGPPGYEQDARCGYDRRLSGQRPVRWALEWPCPASCTTRTT